MKQTPTIWQLRSLIQSTQQVSTLVEVTKQHEGFVVVEHHWVPKRPEGAIGIKARFKAAWLVFTGQADAVIWPQQQ